MWCGGRGVRGGGVDTHWQQHQPNEREIQIIVIRIIVYLTEQRNLGVSQSSDKLGNYIYSEHRYLISSKSTFHCIEQGLISEIYLQLKLK